MQSAPTKAIDPVCGMEVDRQTAIIVDDAGASYHFCDIACAETFGEEPERWTREQDREPLEHAH